MDETNRTHHSLWQHALHSHKLDGAPSGAQHRAMTFIITNGGGGNVRLASDDNAVSSLLGKEQRELPQKLCQLESDLVLSVNWFGHIAEVRPP